MSDDASNVLNISSICHLGRGRKLLGVEAFPRTNPESDRCSGLIFSPSARLSHPGARPDDRNVQKHDHADCCGEEAPHSDEPRLLKNSDNSKSPDCGKELVRTAGALYVRKRGTRELGRDAL